MRKIPLSVTLAPDNLAWLHARAPEAGSVSRVLDALVTDARQAQSTGQAPSRSVAGTIRIPGSEQALAAADAEVRALFRGARRRARA